MRDQDGELETVALAAVVVALALGGPLVVPGFTLGSADSGSSCFGVAANAQPAGNSLSTPPKTAVVTPTPTDTTLRTAAPAPEATVDPNADIDDDGNVDEVLVRKAAGQVISGTATVAAGAELSVKITGTDTGSPFVKPLTATVQPDATWRTTADFSGNAQGANFTIDVRNGSTTLLDGKVDGRIAAAPTASVTFNDQESFGDSVVVSSVTMSDGGYVAIHYQNDNGEIYGSSTYLSAGSASDVDVTLDRPLNDDAPLVAMPHQDTDGDRTFEFQFGSAVDAPYTENGVAVSDSARVSVTSPRSTATTASRTTMRTTASRTTMGTTAKPPCSATKSLSVTTAGPYARNDAVGFDLAWDAAEKVHVWIDRDGTGLYRNDEPKTVVYPTSANDASGTLRAGDGLVGANDATTARLAAVANDAFPPTSGTSVVASGGFAVDVGIGAAAVVDPAVGSAVTRAAGEEVEVTVDARDDNFASATVALVDGTGTVVDSERTTVGGTGLTESLTVPAGATDGDAFSVDLTVRDAAGNVETVSQPDVVTVANPPRVTSVARSSPTNRETNAGSVAFAVSFSEPVENVDASDFALAAGGSVSGSVAGVSSATGESVTVTVDSLSGAGTLGLDLASDADVTDSIGTPLATADPATDETYAVDAVAPTFAAGVDATVSVQEGTTGTVRDVDAADDGGTAFDADVTYALGGADAGPFGIDRATGELRLDTPLDFESPGDDDADGEYELTVTATDDVGNAATQRLAVDVTDVNEPVSTPTDADPAGNAVPEDAAVGDPVGVDWTASDPEGAPLSWSLPDDADGRFTVDGAGVLRVADPSGLDFEDDVDHTVTVRVGDGAFTAEATATVTVADVAETPTFSGDATASVRGDAGAGTVVTDVDAGVGGGSDAGVTYEITGGNDDVTGSGGPAFAVDRDSGVVRVADADDLAESAGGEFSLVVEASEGTAAATRTVAVEVLDVTAPTADAGSDATVGVGETVTLDGTGSSDLGGITAFEWDIDGDGATDLTGSTPTYTFPDPGTYDVELTVTDAAGNADTDTVTVEVRDTTPPEADARSAATVDAGEQVSFDGSGSTDNVGVATYLWDLDGDGLAEGSGPTPSYTYDAPGTYEVELVVTDAAGNFDVDTTTVTVRDVAAPTADAGPDRTVAAGEALSFDGSGSTDDVGVAAYEWDLDGDGAADATGPTPTRTFAEPGTYAVTLTVADAAGNTDTDGLTVTVTDATGPTADAGPNRTADANESVTLDGSGSSDDVGVATYEWDLDGDGATDLTGATVAHTFASPGTYVVALTVTDAGGNADTDTATVTVRDVDTTPPTAEAGRNLTVRPNETVRLDGSNSTDDRGVASYAWDLDGDGTAEATGPTVDRTFGATGVYEVTLRVTDAAGNDATDTVVVRVAANESAGQHESGVSVRVFTAAAGGDGALDRSDVLGVVRNYVETGAIEGVSLDREDVLALVRYYLRQS